LIFQQNLNPITSQIQSIFDPIDISIGIFVFLFHVPAMTLLHKLFYSKRKVWKPYNESFLGYIEKSVTRIIYFLGILYVTDVLSAICKLLQLELNMKLDIPYLIRTLGSSYALGKLLISVKNWYFQQKWRNNTFLSTFNANKGPKDAGREATLDDLSSLAIWVIISLFSIEEISSRLGIKLTSLFALGGVGSASAILALRSTLENLSGNFYCDDFDIFIHN